SGRRNEAGRKRLLHIQVEALYVSIPIVWIDRRNREAGSCCGGVQRLHRNRRAVIGNCLAVRRIAGKTRSRTRDRLIDQQAKPAANYRPASAKDIVREAHTRLYIVILGICGRTAQPIRANLGERYRSGIEDNIAVRAFHWCSVPLETQTVLQHQLGIELEIVLCKHSQSVVVVTAGDACRCNPENGRSILLEVVSKTGEGDATDIQAEVGDQVATELTAKF